MDLNRKIAFKMSANKINADHENDAAIDLNQVDEFWETVELSIMSKAFSRVILKSLSLKTNVLNTEHIKIKRVHESTEVQDECKEMNE